MSKRFGRFSLLLWVLSVLILTGVAHGADDKVVVELIRDSDGPKVDKLHRYRSMVTLYIANVDGTRTPSGWSTRIEDGAPEDKPFEFQPGMGLIEGWTEGVLQMKEGQRALLHVPASKGYGSREMGTKDGGENSFYIPANSNLVFDLEVLQRTSPDITREVPDL